MSDPSTPTLAERYGHAISSSHLEVKDARCDVDLIVAAGWTAGDGGGLGVALYRLRTEWDSAAGEYRMAQRHLAAAEAALKRAAKMPPENKAKRAEANAALILAAQGALTARALVLVHLTTLRGARDALGAFALRYATQVRYMGADGTVLAIAGRTLQAWLDSQCQACRGKGFTGGWNAPMLICHVCGGTADLLTAPGKHRTTLGTTDAAHDFGRALLGRMDSKCEYIDRQMRKYLNLYGSAVEGPEAEQAKIRARLFDLRSTQAEAD